MPGLRIAVLASLGLVGCASARPRVDNDAILRQISEQAQASGSDSLVILRDGDVLVSEFFGRSDRPRDVQSITKSVTSLAIAALIDDGKIASWDAPLTTWVPEWAEDPRKSTITLRMILNHTSGLPDNARHANDPPGTVAVPIVADFFRSPDLVAAAAKVPLLKTPGSQFLYSSIGASLLTRVIARASGRSVADFVQERLFAPLGIRAAQWTKDAAGQELTSGGLMLRTADLLKIGLFIENEGEYLGKSLLRPETVRTLLARSQPFTDYGLLWWRYPNGVVAARGWGGQYIAVYPDKKIVAVRTRDPFTIDERRLDVQAFRNFAVLIAQFP